MWFSFIVVLAVGLVLAAPPTPEQLEQALQQLGDDRYQVREQATMFLWLAGPAAEPYLQRALQSNDAEVVARAKDLLDKIPFGITPDSPKKYVALVARARAANATAWDGIVTELLSEGSDGLDIAKNLAEKQADPQRRAEFRRGIDKQGWRIAHRYIAAGDLARAEELLSKSAAANANPAADFAQLQRHYAAFLRVQGSLSAKRPQWDKWAEGREGVEGFLPDGTPDGPAAQRVAAYLAKAAGDFARARQLADQIGPTAWLEMTRFDAGAWHDMINVVPPDRANMVMLVNGLKMMYSRLAGNKELAAKLRAEFEQSIGEAKQSEPDAWLAFRAIMFDGRPEDALKWIEDVPFGPAKIARAEIMAQRGQIDSALKLLTSTAGQRHDQFSNQAAKARLLALIGDRQLLMEQLGRMKKERYEESTEQVAATDFVEQLIALHLPDAAMEQAAALLSGNHSSSEVFSKLFPKSAAAADAWWNYLRSEQPDESALDLVKRIPALTDQRLNDPKSRQLLDKALAWTKDRPAADQTKLLRGFAEALHLAGQSEAALNLLTKATDANAQAIQLKIGDILFELGRFREAAEAYERSWKEETRASLPVWLASLARERAGDLEAAQKLRLIARLLPLGDEAERTSFCDELAKRSDFGDAVREELRFQRRLIVDLSHPSSNPARNALSLLCQDGSQFADRQAAADANQKFLVRMLRTNAYFKRNEGYLIVLHRQKAEQARAALANNDIAAVSKLASEAFRLLPTSYTLAVDLVPELTKRELTTEADDIYRPIASTLDQLVKEYPQSAFFAGNRAWLAARCRRDLDRALTLAQKAVELQPDSAAHRETLSEVYFQKGDGANAKAALQPALAKQPRNLYLQKLMRRIEAGDTNAALPER
jgi:predicted negative regulator of RcsB-dependent stress response